MVCGCLRQPQIAKGGLLWEQIYPQEPDGRPVASSTGTSLPGINILCLTFTPCNGCTRANAACLHMDLSSLGMLIADVPCANMPLLRWAATSVRGNPQLAATLRH